MDVFILFTAPSIRSKNGARGAPIDAYRITASLAVRQNPVVGVWYLAVAEAALPAEGHGRHSAALLFRDEGKPFVPVGSHACLHAPKMNAGLAAA
jgi:hypothetical protein